jgi:hypothetical protein
MKPVAHINRVICVSLVLIVIVVLSLGAPSEAGTMYPYWIDDITGAIAFYKEGLYFKQEYPHAKWDLYIEQMRVVQATYQGIPTPPM